MSGNEIAAWAGRLLELTEGAARAGDMAVGREEARAVGEEINLAGGFELMREVAHAARDIGRMKGQPFALGYIERWWNGIGSWQS